MLKGRFSRYALAGAAMYCAALVATAPARVADTLLRRASATTVVLTNTSGSLWSGRAQGAMVRSGNGTPFDLGILEWRVRPLRLAAGELAASLETGGRSHLSADVAMGLGGLIVRRASGTIDAGVLVLLLPKLAGWKPSGVLQVASDGFSASRGTGEGAVTLEWRGARFAGREERMGDYRIVLHGAADGMRLSLSTLSGPLRLDGEGRWTRAEGWTLEATAAAPRDVGATLGDLAKLLGPPGADGKYRIRL